MDSINPSIRTEAFQNVEMFRYCEQCGRCSSACPLTGVDGFNIRRLLRFVELDLIDEIADSTMPWSCATCGRCEDACPHGIRVLDIVRGLRAVCPDERLPAHGAPCVEACPAGIDVPGYLRLIAEGKYDVACELVMEKAPFPGILGRVCNRPCETVCVRGRVNAPVAICAAKRFAADHAEKLPDRVFETQADTGRSVAIIGAGPAGLTAAFYLRKKGHRVTVFEARNEPGGMLRYGIPYYRLPEEVLDREIGRVLSVGVELRTGQKLGGNLEPAQLRREGYDAVFVAVGAQASKKIPLEGSDRNDVLWGLEFLVRVNEGEAVDVRDSVVVVGGGSVAVDVALTAKRLGAKRVVMACLEKREEMPALPWEVEIAEEEGVEILNSWGPYRIAGSNGTVSAVELVRCVSVFDADGKFAPEFDEAKHSLDTDQVILAIGQSTELEFCSDFDFAAKEKAIPVTSGLISADPHTQETGVEGVFAGGDTVTGPSTIVNAIASGRRAAIHIDRYLGGDGVLVPDRNENTVGVSYDGRRTPGFADRKRIDPQTLAIDERHEGFAEVERCLDEQNALKEVNRCLHCDLEYRLVMEARGQAEKEE